MDRSLTPSQKRFLSSFYFDPKQPAAFSGYQKLWKELVKRGKEKEFSKVGVRKWLNSQETYSLHKPLRRNFKRRIVYVESIDEQFEADLIVFEDYSNENGGNKYIFVCIDVFSKYAWAFPLKTKKGAEVKKCLEKVFTERTPISLRTDSGGEFVNSTVKKYLTKMGVNHVISRNETKSNIVERFIRTFKGKLFRYFTKNQSHKYIDVLANLIASYNNTYHRSIKMSPSEVTNENEQRVWENLYPSLLGKRETKIETKTKVMKKKKLRKKPFKFKVGDTVRISYIKYPFSRGFNQQWTDELFKIDHRTASNPFTYKLVDFTGEKIIGTFYESELSSVTASKNPLYRIEKIIMQRKRKGKVEYLVKWVGWPEKFNSYVTKKELSAIKLSKSRKK